MQFSDSLCGFLSPVDKKGSRFPVWWKEGFLSPVDTKGSRFPVWWKEGFLSPVDTKGSRFPVWWKEGFPSPVDRKGSRFPVLWKDFPQSQSKYRHKKVPDPCAESHVSMLRFLKLTCARDLTVASLSIGTCLVDISV